MLCDDLDVETIRKYLPGWSIEEIGVIVKGIDPTEDCITADTPENAIGG